MGVKLSFALMQDKVVHIEDKVDRSKLYLCPFCKEEVRARKGQVNAPHFSHSPESTCSISYETLLHFNAKHYLLNEDDIEINFPIKFLIGLKDILSSLELSNLPIKLNKILKYYHLAKGNGKVEKGIGNYVADVLFECDQIPFVCEILVTHAMEDEKRNYFKNEKIPYIEIKPFPTLENKFSFSVTDYYLPGFMEKFEQEILHKNLENTYNSYHQKFIEDAKKELVTYDQTQMAKDVSLNQLLEVVDKLNFRDYITTELYKRMISIPVSPKGMGDRLEEIRYIERQYKHTRINGKYYVNNETDILRQMLFHFREQGIRIEAIIGKDDIKGKEKVIGYNFLLPSRDVTGEQMRNILKSIVNKLLQEIHTPF